MAVAKANRHIGSQNGPCTLETPRDRRRHLAANSSDTGKVRAKTEGKGMLPSPAPSRGEMATELMGVENPLEKADPKLAFQYRK